MRDDDSIDYRSAALAAAVSLGLHLLLIWLMPQTFHQAVVVLRPVEVLTAPVVIDERRLPLSMRFAEANNAANQAVPKAAEFFAARNQTAAQPVPEKNPTRSSLPKSAGKSDQVKVAQAVPRSIEESQAAPAAAPSVAMAPKPAGPSAGPGERTDAPPKAATEAAPAPANPERPRARVPSGTSGLLLRNAVGVNSAGMLSVNCRFSNYGDYVQRMLEAVQSSWWSTIQRSRFETVTQGSVVVSFRLHRDGTVTEAQILSSDVPRIMALACKDAVMAPAPYDAWRADMVAQFGEQDTVTIHFFYY